MGRGPEQRPSLRKLTSSVALGLTIGGAAGIGMAFDSQVNITSGFYRMVDRSVPPSQGETYKEKYDDAYWQKRFAKIDEIGISEQSKREAWVAYTSMGVFFISLLAYVELQKPAPRIAR